MREPGREPRSKGGSQETKELGSQGGSQGVREPEMEDKVKVSVPSCGGRSVGELGGQKERQGQTETETERQGWCFVINVLWHLSDWGAHKPSRTLSRQTELLTRCGPNGQRH